MLLSDLEHMCVLGWIHNSRCEEHNLAVLWNHPCSIPSSSSSQTRLSLRTRKPNNIGCMFNLYLELLSLLRVLCFRAYRLQCVLSHSSSSLKCGLVKNLGTLSYQLVQLSERVTTTTSTFKGHLWLKFNHLHQPSSSHVAERAIILLPIVRSSTISENLYSMTLPFTTRSITSPTFSFPMNAQSEFLTMIEMSILSV